MRVFTMAELRTILRESAGYVEVQDGGPDVADTSYLDLGYESLALLEVSARIRQTLGVDVPDAAVVVTATPAQTLAAVNTVLRSKASGVPA